MKVFSLLFSICFFQWLHAQELVLPLWPAGKVPNHQKSDERERIDSGETIKVTLVQAPEITVYLPTRRSATGQAVIICPGGGYSYLSYNWEGTDPARWLNSKGIAAIVLKYRLPEVKSNVVPHQSPLADATRALRLVRANAARWGLKPDRIGIMGFSAGGHLASTLATHFDGGSPNAPDSVERFSSRPDFAVLVYPVISMSRSIMHTGSRNRLIGERADSALANFYSGERQVTAQTPPCFLVHATDDKTVPVENSLLFYQALKDHNIPAELHVFPKGGHGFGLGLGRGAVEGWTNLCIDWLRGLNASVK